MPQEGEHPDREQATDAWGEAERYGVDMSGLLANLNKTVQERIRNHDRALTLAQTLQRAMAERYGEFREPPGTPD